MYIVFEGIVGSGKTTQIHRLQEYLSEDYPNRKIIVTREPGGDLVADEIRRIAQNVGFDGELDPTCEAYLYAASRSQTLRTVVVPALMEGGIVISDRSYLSSLAFQGEARGLPFEVIRSINEVATSIVTPDLVIFFDVDIENGLSRVKISDPARGEEDKFEAYDIEFFRRVQEGYDKALVLPELEGRVERIDANRGIDEVFEDLKQVVEGRIFRESKPERVEYKFYGF